MNTESFNDEKDLLRRISEGDEAAFTQIFHRYRNKIFTVARKLTESDTASEEIVQDVFLKIWLKRDKLPTINDFASYLFIIARNHTFTYLKQLARAEKMQHGLQENLPVVSLSADAMLLDKNYEAILQKAINRLTIQQKKVYQYSKEEGLKREEIAEKMGLSPETVKIHLGNAMKIIRAYCITKLGLPLILFVIYNYLEKR